MRILSLIILTIILVVVNTAYGLNPALAGFAFSGTYAFVGNLMYFTLVSYAIGQHSIPKSTAGYWMNLDTNDIEQLQLDYGLCGSTKKPKSCMEERGYIWWPTRTGFWDKADADKEQRKRDYEDCRAKGHGWPCMEAKGYIWKHTGTGFWHKAGVDIEQLIQDYGECRMKDRPCMEEKGYTWVPFIKLSKSN